MPQRPRLSQVRRTDINYRTFHEQYQELEREASYLRKPVETPGDLPQVGNKDGDECLVLSTDVKYRWSAALQNWRPILGKAFDLPTGTVRRHREKYIAVGGETEIMLPFRYEVGAKTLEVYIQGVLQELEEDYVEVDDMTIRFLSPLEAGMKLTFMTPYIVGNPIEDVEIRDRLKNLEYNTYRLMLSSYYAGKPVTGQGIVFDGFINTSYVDYAIGATSEIMYDNVRTLMYPNRSVISKFQEVFDNTSLMSMNTTAYIRGSEATLPIKTTYDEIFADDFSETFFMDPSGTTAYHNIEKQYVTTDEFESGGDHYFQGDCMATTGNADRVAYSRRYEHYYCYDTYNWRWAYEYPSQQPHCYAVVAMGNITSVVMYDWMIYENEWPYDGGSWHYRDGNDDNDQASGFSAYRNSLSTLWPYYDGYSRPALAYVYNWNKLVVLYQYHEGSEKYYQRLYSSNGRNRELIWTLHNRPSGLPNTTFGSAVTTFTQSTEVIDQIGSTKNELLLRVKDKVYFLNSAYQVTRVLDWTNAERKPSLFNQNSIQFTCDGRFIYFPARLLRGELGATWGYYLEVFSLEDGSFIDEILITLGESGYPGTTAMSYDHEKQRLVLGLWGRKWYSLAGKNFNDYNVNSNYAGFISFAPPTTGFSSLQSIPIKTNLPKIDYNLQADHTLNNGVIDYYIRFNDGPWSKINLNTNYSWTNPSGAKETKITLRAMLRADFAQSTAPTLTRWALKIKTFDAQALYESKEQVLSLTGVTGGKIFTSQDIPQETTLQWTIQLDPADPEIQISSDGSFAIEEGLTNANATLRARLATINPLFSPVIRDVTLNMHYVNAARLESTIFEQAQDITQSYLWVTTNGNSQYLEPSISRDGGTTWIKGVREDVLQIQDGKTETTYSFNFAGGTEDYHNKLKVRFDITGAVEIDQYGLSINPI